MRVLVCGGRNFSHNTKVFRELDFINTLGSGIELLIEGGATGADYIAREWCRRRDIPNITFNAEWTLHGKQAGPLRNQRMIDEGRPDLVLAFPGGRGTADMVRRAREAGVEVVEIS